MNLKEMRVSRRDGVDKDFMISNELRLQRVYLTSHIPRLFFKVSANKQKLDVNKSPVKVSETYPTSKAKHHAQKEPESQSTETSSNDTSHKFQRENENSAGRRTSFLETILNEDAAEQNNEEINNTIMHNDKVSYSQHDQPLVRKDKGDRKPKTAVVRPQVYQCSFANFRSHSTMSNPDETDQSVTESVTETSSNNHASQQTSSSDAKTIVICKNPKAMVRRRSLMSKSASGPLVSVSRSNTLPPGMRPKTAPGNKSGSQSQSRPSTSCGTRASMPKTQGKAFTQSGEASSKDSMALVSVSKNSPPVRVLSLMEKDRLASEFVRVGERVLVDLSRKKCMYFQFVQS